MDVDSFDLEAQQRALADQAERERRAERRLESDIKWLMSGQRGRRLAWWFLGTCGLHVQNDEASPPAYQFAAGRRLPGVALQQRINRVCPAEHIGLMVTENNEERETRDDGDGTSNDA